MMILLLMHLSIIKLMIKKKIRMLTLQIQILITSTQTLSKLVQVKDLKQITIHPN